MSDFLHGVYLASVLGLIIVFVYKNGSNVLCRTFENRPHMLVGRLIFHAAAQLSLTKVSFKYPFTCVVENLHSNNIKGVFFHVLASAAPG